MHHQCSLRTLPAVSRVADTRVDVRNICRVRITKQNTTGTVPDYQVTPTARNVLCDNDSISPRTSSKGTEAQIGNSNSLTGEFHPTKTFPSSRREPILALYHDHNFRLPQLRRNRPRQRHQPRLLLCNQIALLNFFRDRIQLIRHFTQLS